MISNYTIIDVLGTAKAAMLMSLFVFVPGYVLGWTLNVLGFRRRRAILKIALSVPLAIAYCPVLTYLLGRTGPYGVWVFYGVTWTVFAILVAIRVVQRRLMDLRGSRYLGLSLAAACIWLAIGVCSLVDLQLGDRLYYSVPAYDYSVRTAFTAASARTIPPSNPFFAWNPPIPLRYHYFWPLLCSLVARIGNLAPRHAMFGGTLWCGLGLLSLIALWVKFFLKPACNVERKSLIGVGLLMVTGLDILPTVVLRLQEPRVVKPDMEWWNSAQITSWLDSMIWVPHHIAGLIACLIGFLVLRVEKRRGVAAVTAGVAFASAVGLSIYVAMTFAVFMALWGLMALVLDRRRTPAILAVGALAICISWPFLSTLAGPGQGGGFIVQQVRSFSFATDLLQRYGVQQFWAEEVAPVALLPVNYFLELGFFLLVAIDRARRLWKKSIAWTRDEVTGWLAVLSSFLIGTFFRSSTIANNDLGYRSLLLAQFVLLLWAIPLIDDWLFSRHTVRPRRGSTKIAGLLAGTCLMLGVIGTTYQLIELRLYSVAADHWSTFRRSWMDGDGQLGKRTYALRRAYEELDRDIRPASVVQFNPLTVVYVPNLLYTAHPAAAVGQDCGTEFGGRVSNCTPRIQELSRMFGDTAPSDEEQVDEICRANGIDVLLAKDTDPVWWNRASWVWRKQPVVANAYARAFLCGYSDSAKSVRTSVSGP